MLQMNLVSTGEKPGYLKAGHWIIEIFFSQECREVLEGMFTRDKLKIFINQVGGEKDLDFLFTRLDFRRGFELLRCSDSFSRKILTLTYLALSRIAVMQTCRICRA